MPTEIIAIASDHAGFAFKSALADFVREQGYEVLDLGTDGAASVDYPDFADALAAAIRDGRVARGILVCGSGIGISIAANRHREVRAALVHDSLGAHLAREHNDANVICFGGRTTGLDTALDALKVFLTTDFDGGERHARRVAKLSKAD